MTDGRVFIEKLPKEKVRRRGRMQYYFKGHPQFICESFSERILQIQDEDEIAKEAVKSCLLFIHIMILLQRPRRDRPDGRWNTNIPDRLHQNGS